ncbi:ribosome biogenesis protein ENP2 [Strigomonas culicis]|uniref:Ribosome biogenesis protein ENP2 n=1 Tax=Strigomonas culicis TaxID=28005 RepID=S9TKK4_9TRYP|nr:ribosome biogenesis protein ENP2 [Strigomonas culicis]|eukprot:EPY18717.1 ribosome biogenesis protein ENP2 [Strigomonas culicis]
MDHEGGLLFCCGDEAGKVYVYDVRLQKPLLVKDHMNSLPITKTYFFNGRNNYNGAPNHFIVSADTRSVKIWEKESGTNFTSIEAPAEIFDFMFFKREANKTAPPYAADDSGVLAICCDAPRVQVHFTPQLAPAPRWASFLDIIADDLQHPAEGGAADAGAQVVYDDYTFVPQEKMQALGIMADDLAGGRVRPVMHGAFIENRLYRELQAVLHPGHFNDYVQAKKQQRKDERWGDRISRFKRAAPADDDRDDDHTGEAVAAEGTRPATRAAKAADAAQELAQDPRFAKLLPGGAQPHPLFALDHRNPEYRRLLKTIEERKAKANERRARYEKDMFTIVPDVGEADGAPPATTATAADEDAADDARQHLKGVHTSGRYTTRQPRQQQQTSVDDAPSTAAGGGTGVTMFEVPSDMKHLNPFTQSERQVHHQRKKVRAEHLTLEDRLKKMKKGK